MAALTTASSIGSHPPSPHSGGTFAAIGAIGALTKRSSSVPGSARGTVCSTETDVVPLFRKHLEATEEKLAVQIGRVQQQNEKLRDAAFSRVDAKLGGFEALQPKIDRRLAELSGNFQGLSAELQVQIRRIDQMDSRLRSWKQELEEMVDAKFVELERSFQQIESSARLSSSCSEDNMSRWSRRLLRLEGLLDERTAAADDVNQTLLNLHARLSQIEDAQEAIPVMPAHAVEQVRETGAGSVLESQIDDAMFKLQRSQSESRDLQIRVEAQEERLKSLRTLMETKDECVRSLSDRLESADWEGHFKELQDQLASLDRRCQSVEQKGCRQEQIVVVQEEVQGCVSRLDKLEQHEAADISRSETLTMRELLKELREVAPRVIQHEALLQELARARQSNDLAGETTKYLRAAVHFLRCKGPAVQTLWKQSEARASRYWKTKSESERLLDFAAVSDAKLVFQEALANGLSPESLAEGLALALERFKLVTTFQIESLIQSSLDELGGDLESESLSEEEYDVTSYRHVFIAASDELRRASLIV